MSGRVTPSPQYRFGRFTLDPTERRLFLDDETIKIAPKVFDTLQILIESQGALVRRADLIEKLWPDTSVEDGTLGRNISDLRKILDDADHKLIETIPRIGYRFIGDITVIRKTVPINFTYWGYGVGAALVVLIAVIYFVSPNYLKQPSPSTAVLAFSRGRFWFEKRTEAGLRRSIDYYSQAAAADPGNAQIYAALAESYLLLSGYGFDSPEKYIPLAREAAKHALALDGSLGEAHNALALIAENYDLDWATALAEYRRAIELRPRYATARHFYGEFLVFMGKIAEGRRELELAQTLEPTSLIIATDYAQSFLYDKQYKRSIELLRQVLNMDPSFVRARYWLTLATSLDGDCAGAADSLARLVSVQRGAATSIAAGVMAARCGDRAGALRAVAELSQAQTWSGIGGGLILTQLGDMNGASQCLREGVRRREIGIVTLKASPLLERARADARVGALVAQLRFP